MKKIIILASVILPLVFIFGYNTVGGDKSSQDSVVSSMLVQTARLFYPNINDNKYYYIDKEISFRTNDITRLILQEEYKNTVVNQAGAVFSKNTTINSLYKGSDDMVYIDLNKMFLTEMNAGAGYEEMILQSIANTFGYYYALEKVILTIDGGLYESGHISKAKGEYIGVNYSFAVNIK